MATTPDELLPDAESGIPVELPSGAQFLVLNDDERVYVESRVNDYQSQLHLENVSDLAELDRVVGMELLCHRWASWLARTHDYWGEEIDEVALRRTLTDMSK